MGADLAPTNCFKAIGPKLEAKGVETVSVLGAGKPFEGSTGTVKGAVRDADLVVLGLSSSPERAKLEMVVAEFAREAGIPYGFYSDMALCPFRTWLCDLARNTSFIVGLLPTSEELAEMYPQARVYPSGNPLRGTMAFPELSRDVVREKLGVKPHEKLIVAPGGKFPAGNFQLWGLLIETLEVLKRKEDIVLLLAPHPGDAGARAIDKESGVPLNIYKEMTGETSVRTLYNMMPTPVATAGADLVVDFTGDTSVRAAMLRIPLLNVTTEILLRRFERETGSRQLETIENGSGFNFIKGTAGRSSGEIVYALLFDEELRGQLRARQEIAYPIPANPEEPTKLMIDALMKELAG